MIRSNQITLKANETSCTHQLKVNITTNCKSTSSYLCFKCTFDKIIFMLVSIITNKYLWNTCTNAICKYLEAFVMGWKLTVYFILDTVFVYPSFIRSAQWTSAKKWVAAFSWLVAWRNYQVWRTASQQSLTTLLLQPSDQRWGASLTGMSCCVLRARRWTSHLGWFSIERTFLMTCVQVIVFLIILNPNAFWERPYCL